MAVKDVCDAGRVPVLVAGSSDAIKLRASCIRFVPPKTESSLPPQVLGLQDMLRQRGSVKAHLRVEATETSKVPDVAAAKQPGLGAQMPQPSMPSPESLLSSLRQDGSAPDLASIMAMANGEGIANIDPGGGVRSLKNLMAKSDIGLGG
eukprot:TRINITY_DN25714_c0_g1_i5.p1 TRINITY_DN25714_c0_g1~~TRINITY_DN25714_c0_g1_i5.p1  ORF type:complete len:149 (-),score=21.51 TRINITY_DN25714_c0_g1_i5:66-512(-)